MKADPVRGAVFLHVCTENLRQMSNFHLNRFLADRDGRGKGHYG